MTANSTTAKELVSPTIFSYVVFFLALSFYVYDYFIQVAPGVMTAQLMDAFSIKAGALGFLSGCFYYSYTLMQVPAGLLLDRLGPRKIISISAFISALGVVLFSMTHLFWLAGVSRFLIGMGSSCAFLAALMVVYQWFPHRHFAIFAGLIQFAACVGSIFAEAPLALAINSFGWRQVMLFTGVMTFVLSAIFWLCMRDRKTQHHIDSAHASGFKSLLMSLKTVLREPQVIWISLCGLISWMSVAGVGALWGVPYLMKVYGWSNVEAGKWASLFWVGVGFGSPFFGWLSNKIKSRNKPMLICFFTGFIAVVMFLSAPSFPPWLIGITLFLLGCSASVQALTFSVVKDNVKPSVFGAASGIVNMAAILGGGLAQVLIGYLMEIVSHGVTFTGTPVYTVKDYQWALSVLLIAMLAGIFLVCFKVKETHCKEAVK